MLETDTSLAGLGAVLSQRDDKGLLAYTLLLVHRDHFINISNTIISQNWRY